MTDGSSGNSIDRQRLPLIVKIYGALCLISGAVRLPLLIALIVVALRGLDPGSANTSLTFILTCEHATVLVVNAAALIVFGILLLRNRRRHAARWAYGLIPVTLLEGLLNLALYGLDVTLLLPLVQLILLVIISITADPSLHEERRLQRRLRQMDARDAYEESVRVNMAGRDLTGRGYISLDFFNLFWVFVFTCVIGLGIETVYHWILFGEYQDRAGLLWGPFSPIYGFGGVLLTVFLNRLWDDNPVLIFLASAVIGGAFEYFTSWFMQVAFGITAWDYTGQWLSINGRTSGKYMIMWGLLGLAWIKLCLPQLLRLINRIPWKWRYSLTAVAFVLMFVDGTATLMALDCWYTRMAGMEPGSPIEVFFGEHFDDAYMQHRFQTMTIDPSMSGRV
ncbi:putative ABC transporter permease [Bifidobacterium simiarum]|uniref:putative ABC transporter permease n=1 Tax=Bifidobacterium simiarum TaxID=2045441 RepID=UPI001BDD6013|nr:putative ABC transporter permease [Bifidobacterium simiarum]